VTVARFLVILAVLAVFGVTPPPASAAEGDPDDTAFLQAMIDAGGKVMLPQLPDGDCYRTYGLWVSKNNTTISSNGACIIYLGPGPARLTSSDGDPIAADAIFFVNRSSSAGRLPQRIVISNILLQVPPGTNGHGVVVSGHNVALTGITVVGAPLDAVLVTGRGNGLGYASRVAIRKSTFIGARRNAISIVGAIGVTIDSNTITGAGNPEYLRGAWPAWNGPWAGIDVEPDVVRYPVKWIQILNNEISKSYGAGILLALMTNWGSPKTADGIVVSGNTITGNGAGGGPPLRGGICLHGGQADGNGRLMVSTNEIALNGGFGLCNHPEGNSLQISLSGNTVHGNTDGESNWFTPEAPPAFF
jgi:hypothetical protein